MNEEWGGVAKKRSHESAQTQQEMVFGETNIGMGFSGVRRRPYYVICVCAICGRQNERIDQLINAMSCDVQVVAFLGV